jgi:hypothetical protein
MGYKQNTHEKGSVKIRLDSAKGLWDLVLAAPGIYHGEGTYEVPTSILEVLDKKGISYKRIDNKGVVA